MVDVVENGIKVGEHLYEADGETAMLDGSTSAERAVRLLAHFKALASEGNAPALLRAVPDGATPPSDLTAAVAMVSAIADLTKRCGDIHIHGECTEYTRASWRHEVSDDSTHLGYWEWVVHQAEGEGVALPDLTVKAS